MQIHYGVLGNFIENVKAILTCFRGKSSDIQRHTSFSDPNTLIRTHDKAKMPNCLPPSYLDAKIDRINQLCKLDTKVFKYGHKITIVSYSLPQFDKTSSEFRLFNILKILLANKCKIDYIYCTKSSNDKKYLRPLNGDITFRYLPMDEKRYVQSIVDGNPEYVWITELWRLNYVRSIADIIEKLNKLNNRYEIIVDTVDFHYKEFYRKYEISKNSDDLDRANYFLEFENVLYKSADTVIVVSEDEKKDIQYKISDIKNIRVIPNIHKISDFVRPYSKRKNLCFVGHFGNKHNVNAVKYFIDKIFPLILAKNPKTDFHVIGRFSERYKREFGNHNVRVIGSLRNLEKALSYYKLFVCPMTYGAGMKGKIGSAIVAGVPVVTTSVGAEGFGFEDGEECFIADSPLEFAERSLLCLSDPVIWQNLMVNSRLKIVENCSPAAVAEKLKNIFAI